MNEWNANYMIFTSLPPMNARRSVLWLIKKLFEKTKDTGQTGIMRSVSSVTSIIQKQENELAEHKDKFVGLYSRNWLMWTYVSHWLMAGLFV